MAIEGENRAVAMHHRTRDGDLIVPPEGAVWRRDGRCADVLAETAGTTGRTAAVTATIRVRVNPADNREYVIYADPEDSAQPWVRAGGAVTGWEYDEAVADWPEFELPIPGAADPDPERSGSPPTRAARRERLHVCRGSG